MDQIDTAIAITANADKNMPQISFSPTGSDMLLMETGSSARPFGGYLFQFSQGVTPDPPPIIIHLTHSDFKMAIKTTVSIYVFSLMTFVFFVGMGIPRCLGNRLDQQKYSRK